MGDVGDGFECHWALALVVAQSRRERVEHGSAIRTETLEQARHAWREAERTGQCARVGGVERRLDALDPDRGEAGSVEEQSQLVRIDETQLRRRRSGRARAADGSDRVAQPRRAPDR